ncbi:MAG: hypothetical protein JO036_02450 [Candidatus Eremiobacteraeota bacterium]|nr:hypothetical protein [Candidatus Eremiobacteraeota bacterium]
MSTLFVFLFAIACVATFAFGFKEQWKTARVVSAAVAIFSFAAALFAVSVHR